MNMNLLKAIMAKNNENQGDLADLLGLPQSAISARMSGKVDFKRLEIELIRLRYHLSSDEVMDIFFPSEVSDPDTDV